MPRASEKRERLIRSADNLILHQGFKQTTLSDIARESGVPLGNVYYYFKTKEDIGQTVVDTRIQALESFMQQCNRYQDAKDRLLAFLEFPVQHRETLVNHGCPFGTLAYELHKIDNKLNTLSKKLLEVFLDWSQEQFEHMGKTNAKELSLQFVANLQGMNLIASTTGDATVIDCMVKRTRDWIVSL